MDLVERIYEVSSRFPRVERFGLTAQIRRAAVSVPSNIGEGARRRKTKVEVEVQLEIARRLRFLSGTDYRKTQLTVEEIGRMLNRLILSQESRE